jgi:hypothetical protein
MLFNEELGMPSTPVPGHTPWPSAHVSEAPCTCAGHQALAPRARRGSRLHLEQDDVKNGLGQLVLTLVKLLHELLEKQALRRIEAGSLTDAQIERLGLTLMRQAQEIDRLRQAFKLKDEDLNIDLGPLGRLL